MCWLVMGNFFSFLVKIFPGLFLKAGAKEMRFGFQVPHYCAFTLLMDLSRLGKV